LEGVEGVEKIGESEIERYNLIKRIEIFWLKNKTHYEINEIK
jgi:hypothetical protein